MMDFMLENERNLDFIGTMCIICSIILFALIIWCIDQAQSKKYALTYLAHMQYNKYGKKGLWNFIEVISNSSQSLLKIDGDKLHRFIHSIAVPSTKKLNYGLLELKGQRCTALINLVINNRLIEIDEEKVRNNKTIVNTSKIFEHLKSLRPDINFGSYSGMQKYFSINIHEDVKEIYNNYQKQYKSFN